MWEPSTDSVVQSWGTSGGGQVPQQSLGAGAAEIQGPAAHRGGATGGGGGRNAEPALQGVGEALERLWLD